MISTNSNPQRPTRNAMRRVERLDCAAVAVCPMPAMPSRSVRMAAMKVPAMTKANQWLNMPAGYAARADWARVGGRHG